MIALAWLFLYFIECLSYYLVYGFLYDEKIKSIIAPIAGGVVFLAFCFLSPHSTSSSIPVFAHVLPIIILMCALKCKITERISRTLIVFFVINCISELLLTIDEWLITGTDSESGDVIHELVIYAIELLLFLAYYFYRRRKKKNPIVMIKSNRVIYSVIFMASVMLFTVSGLNWARKHIDNEGFKNMAFALCILSYAGICLLGLFSIYVEKTNKKLVELRENEKMITAMQSRYYETLLEREEDTRKFRHDIGNHIICLDQLTKKGDIEALSDYIRGMESGIEKIRAHCYETGNDIIDILTNHYTNILPENVKVHVSGSIRTKVDQIKLCTIYSNLLANATEELKKCTGPAELDINFSQGREYALIEIKNTLSEESLKRNKEEMTKTSKKDTRNHGLGLKNVRRTLEELSGRLDMEVTPEAFITRASFKA